MKEYTYSEARQRLKAVLERARREGAVRIRRRDGSVFVLRPDVPRESPLDVPGLRGAKHLAQLKPLRCRYSIVGEPTSLQPIRAGKGYSLAEVVVKGREAHSAYPALGASAVFRAARNPFQRVSPHSRADRRLFRSHDPRP